MNPILNPANPISPLNPANPVGPVHQVLFHSSNTVDTVAETAVPDTSVVVEQQTDNGGLLAFLFLGIILGFVLGNLWAIRREL